MTSIPKNVLVVEDDATIADEIAAKLRDHRHRVKVAHTLRAARSAVQVARFDAAVLDLQLPDGSGLELLPLPMPSLVLTILDDEHASYRALARGANGYLVKPEGIARVAHSIDELIAGGSPISPRIARWLLEDFRAATRAMPLPSASTLTMREQDIVEHFATGATYAEIARALGITANTVRTHVRNIYDKLNVASKTEAVLKTMPHARYSR